jgi:hypothetical protein
LHGRGKTASPQISLAFQTIPARCPVPKITVEVKTTSPQIPLAFQTIPARCPCYSLAENQPPNRRSRSRLSTLSGRPLGELSPRPCAWLPVMPSPPPMGVCGLPSMASATTAPRRAAPLGCAALNPSACYDARPAARSLPTLT